MPPLPGYERRVPRVRPAVVLGGVRPAVPVGVDLARVRVEEVLAAVRQPVAVGVLGPVLHAVPVRVDPQGMRAGPELEPVRAAGRGRDPRTRPWFRRRSVSQRRGFVLAMYSWRFVRPSASGFSSPSARPSPSVSARFGLVRLLAVSNEVGSRSWSGSVEVTARRWARRRARRGAARRRRRPASSACWQACAECGVRRLRMEAARSSRDPVRERTGPGRASRGRAGRAHPGGEAAATPRSAGRS